MKKSLKTVFVSLIACLATLIFVGCSKANIDPLLLYVDYDDGYSIQEIARSVDERGGENTFNSEEIFNIIRGSKLPFTVAVMRENGYGQDLERFWPSNTKVGEWGLLYRVDIKADGKWTVVSNNQMPTVENSGEYRLIAEYKNQYPDEFYKKHSKELEKEEAVYLEFYFTVQVVEN